MRAPLSLGTLLALLFLIAACGGTGPPDLDLGERPPSGGGVGERPSVPNPVPVPTPPPPPDVLVGGVLATLNVSGDVCKVWVTDPATMDILDQVWAGTFTMSAFAGKVVSGPGKADHNAPWSWHLEEEFTIDGVPPIYIWVPESYLTPSGIEPNLSYVLTMIRYVAFTPVTLTDLQDYR